MEVLSCLQRVWINITVFIFHCKQKHQEYQLVELLFLDSVHDMFEIQRFEVTVVTFRR